MRRISQMLREIPLEELTGETTTETDKETASTNKSKAYIKSMVPSFAIPAAVILVAVCAALRFIGGNESTLSHQPGQKPIPPSNFELLANDITDNYENLGIHCPITLPPELYTYSIFENELGKEECIALGKDIASAFTGKVVSDYVSAQDFSGNDAVMMDFSDSEKGNYTVSVYNNGQFDLTTDNANDADTAGFSKTRSYRFMPGGEALVTVHDDLYFTNISDIPTSEGISCSPEEAFNTANDFMSLLTDQHDFLPLDVTDNISFVPTEIVVLSNFSPEEYCYDITYSVEIDGAMINDLSYYSNVFESGYPSSMFSAAVTVRVDKNGEIYKVSGYMGRISTISSGDLVDHPIKLTTVLDKADINKSDIFEIKVVLSYNTEPDSFSQPYENKLAPYWRIRISRDPSDHLNPSFSSNSQCIDEQCLYINMTNGEGFYHDLGTGELSEFNLY